jgi:hypothetical protein
MILLAVYRIVTKVSKSKKKKIKKRYLNMLCSLYAVNPEKKGNEMRALLEHESDPEYV